MRKYFVLSAEEGDISILSVHDNYIEACNELEEKIYSCRDKILSRGFYHIEDLQIHIEIDNCISPYGEISFPCGESIYFMVNKFDI